MNRTKSTISFLLLILFSNLNQYSCSNGFEEDKWEFVGRQIIGLDSVAEQFDNSTSAVSSGKSSNPGSGRLSTDDMNI